jgi:hypothetical protein
MCGPGPGTTGKHDARTSSAITISTASAIHTIFLLQKEADLFFIDPSLSDHGTRGDFSEIFEYLPTFLPVFSG